MCLAKNGSNSEINSNAIRKFPFLLEPNISLSPLKARPLDARALTAATTLVKTFLQLCVSFSSIEVSLQSIRLRDIPLAVRASKADL